MKISLKAFVVGAVVVAASVFAFSAFGAEGSSTSPSEAVPEGPEIDFCPTTDQIEAHLEQYGFDYKPTVICGENGEVLADGGEGTSDTPSDARAALENLREELLTARRAPDTDGDPLTMEIILEDGTEKTLFISGNADLFKDVTPRELAEGVGGHADSR